MQDTGGGPAYGANSSGVLPAGVYLLTMNIQVSVGGGTVSADYQYSLVVGCPWDLDQSGTVGINDFLDLLAAWDSNPGGPPDFDGDGTVGITDFLDLLSHWDDCP